MIDSLGSHLTRAKHLAKRLDSHTCLLVFLVVMLYSLPSHALKTADILVTDNESNHIVRVDPDSGIQTEFVDRGDAAKCTTLISSFSPQGLAIDSLMRVYSVNVAEGLPPAPSEIVRFTDGVVGCDFITGGIDLRDSDGLAIERSGTLLVTTSQCASCGVGAPPALIRVDLRNGNQVVVSSGGFFTDPEHIAIDPIDGSIYVADDGNFTSGIPASVLHVDPVSGLQTRIASGGFLFNVSGLAFETPGFLIATERGNKLSGGIAGVTKVIRIHLAIAFPQLNQTLVNVRPPAFQGSRPEFDGIVIEEDGQLVVGVQYDTVATGVSNGALIRMNPATGVQTLLTFGVPAPAPGFDVLEGVDGVAVVPEPGAALMQIVVLAALATLARRTSRPGRTRLRC